MRISLRRVRDRLRQLGPQGPKTRTCYLCKQDLLQLVPYRGGWASFHPFLRDVRVVGSDVDNFNCPLCRCNDRERHLHMYFDALDLWPLARGRVLHVAPERALARSLTALPPVEYVKADLMPTAPDVVRMDVTRIQFGDDHFDLVLCNHVLEHVSDDALALSELFRVLKPGGIAILQTPFSRLLARTFCDAGIDTDELRAKLYGQEDHVRLYGRDLFERIAAAGFGLELKPHAEVLPHLDPARYGVNGNEELIMARKPGAA